MLIAVVVADFAFMIIHYLSHRYAPLWRLHAVHHGVARLYGFNGVMRHPLHQVLDMVIGTAPLVIIGMPMPVAVLLGFVVSVQLIVQHSNVDARLGPLRNHLSIGRIHHLHHVNWGTEGDCNFGLFLTIWDQAARHLPGGAAAPDHGARHGRRRACRTSPRATWSSSCFRSRYKPGQGEPERYRKPTAAASRDAGAASRRIVDAAE